MGVFLNIKCYLGAEKAFARYKKKQHSGEALLESAIKDYNAAYTILNDNGSNLHLERMRALDLIELVSTFVNNISNRPASLNAEIEKIENLKKAFSDVCDFAQKEYNTFEDSSKGVVGGAVGTAAGLAFANFAPNAAIWIATTFGTTSTGIAISSLYGAAATNAALAWLGGGALAAGGAGIAGGNALLALAGPIGLGIAGLSLISSGIVLTVNKKKNKTKRLEEAEKVLKNTTLVRDMIEKIKDILEETHSLREDVSQNYNQVLPFCNQDYSEMVESDRDVLITLVNKTKVLASALSKTLEVN